MWVLIMMVSFALRKNINRGRSVNGVLVDRSVGRGFRDWWSRDGLILIRFGVIRHFDLLRVSSG
jgi:hypothetical protein